jgi:hypothetical protein
MKLERHVPLQADTLFMLILTRWLGQREPGAIQRELVFMSCEKPIDGGCVFLPSVIRG